MDFTRLRGFLIGVCSIPLLVEHLLLGFLFLEGSYSNTFGICIAGLFSAPTQDRLGMRGYFLTSTSLEYLAYSLGAPLVIPGIHSVRLTILLCWRICSVSSGRSLTHLLRALQALSGALALLPPYWFNPLCQGGFSVVWRS